MRLAHVFNLSLLLSTFADDTDVVFIDNGALPSALPSAWADYPASLRGVIWMDQAGVIGKTDLGKSAAPDAAVSLGDPVNKLNFTTRSMFVDTVGSPWMWFNNVLGYREWFDIKFGLGLKGDRWYRFQFNEDYTFAQIYLAYTPWHVEIPKWIVSFSMTLLTPPEGLCPPPPDASTETFTKCATWRRDTSFLFSKNYEYYVYKVIDENGQPIHPYYHKFVQHVQAHTHGDAEEAKKVGLTWKGLDPSMQSYGFVGAESAVGVRAPGMVRTLFWMVAIWLLMLCCGMCCTSCFCGLCCKPKREALLAPLLS